MTHDCDRCGRRFGGTFGFDRHVDRRKDRCRTDAQLRSRELRERPDGVWVRERPKVINLTLFRFPHGHRTWKRSRTWTRRLFGKRWADMTTEERAEYRRLRRDATKAPETLRPGDPGHEKGAA